MLTDTIRTDEEDEEESSARIYATKGRDPQVSPLSINENFLPTILPFHFHHYKNKKERFSLKWK